MVLYMVIAGIVLSILFSAFFSAAEMSFSSLNSVRLENDAKDGKLSFLYAAVANLFSLTVGALVYIAFWNSILQF
ncbi:MAG: DUF21 domain-containing protein [Lachnospiraceae bacterium]|nr:DUF21 domain-containing protein [Lachnospiraceae bacterium]